jgi:sulfite exporter TauE/SafE
VDYWDGYALFLMGFLGTGHCLGMCGPLVFAFPGQIGGMKAHGSYHAGRIATYTIAGLVMGGIGGAIVLTAGQTQANPLVWMTGIQAGLALVAGFFMLGFGLSRMGLLPEPEWMAAATPTRIPGVRRLLRAGDRRPPVTHMFLTGLMMGMLPCGLSFGAFARALATADPLAGAGLTLAFGLGTLPGLLLLGTGLSVLVRRYRRHSDLLAGMVMIALAGRLLVDATMAFFG